MDFENFWGFPDFFYPSIGRSSMKLATRIPYGHSIMTFVFWSPSLEKKISPPMDFEFFWSFPDFFGPYIGRSSMKLATRIPYGHSIMTFVFWSPFFEKINFSPLWTLNFFGVSPIFFALPLVVAQ